MDFGSIFGGAASSFGKGASLSHENRTLPGTNLKSPIMDEFGNFYRLQDEYEDNRQVGQQARLNRLMLNQERASFNQKMELAKQHGIHPLSVLGVPMSSTLVGAGVHESNQPVAGTLDFRKHETPELSAEEKAIQDANVRIAEANARAAESRAVSEEVEARQRASVLLGSQIGPNKISNDQLATQSRLSGVPVANINGPKSIIEIEPSKTTASAPGNPSITAAVSPSLDRVLMESGKEYKVPSQDKLQVDMEGGEMITTLLNWGVPLENAIALTAFWPVLAGAASGFGWLAGKRIGAAKNAAAAAKAARMQAHRRWKGGD